MKNQVNLIGNLGADPELRYTGNGTPVANMRLATNEFWKNKDGERQEHVEWHRIVAWGKLAEICAEHLEKGRLVSVEGKIRTRQWTDKDGNKRYTTEIIARDVTFLGARKTAKAETSQSVDESQVPSADLSVSEEAARLSLGSGLIADNDVPF